jgi:cation:H+ antiporter
MEENLHLFLADLNGWLLAGMIIGLLMLLAKSADKLVGEAVVLSERSGLPKMVIGATIVSLGTTSPEAAVSVLAALQGQPGLALGNAVGSIICDTGLILGIACLIDPPLLPRKIINRQGWVQFGAGVLLVALCWPTDGLNPFHVGGILHQWAGFLLVGLLGVYLWLSVRWARDLNPEEIEAELGEIAKDASAPVALVALKLLIAISLVVASSHFLIPAIEVAATRIGVPPGVIAATLVAFGTSLPELVTAVTASLKGYGDLAIGNVVGADILNVLFVAGLSAAVTPQGLTAEAYFFRIHFPAMLLILITFRVGIVISGDRLKRPFGVLLILMYFAYMVLNYTMVGTRG